MLRKHGVHQRFSLTYHPQTSGQAEVSNRQINLILEKTVARNRKDWSEKLDDALWAHRKNKIPIGTTPYRVVYGKSCHLPVELERRTQWAIKEINFYLASAGEKRWLDLHELEELRWEAYKCASNYKNCTKDFHDHNIENKSFLKRDKVLLYNSRMKLFLEKLSLRWSVPFVVKEVFPHGAMEVWNLDGMRPFKELGVKGSKEKKQKSCQQLGRALQAVCTPAPSSMKKSEVFMAVQSGYSSQMQPTPKLRTKPVV
ncbi:uncharacterized protein LOC110684763 [Chenopodium quinoa]|uniref:uncharacterized protein LOC110684763 n=1 Tax=Chenopodium quinoa TaxID=63459 RepID=UPI000B776232|nr:uncharacterized protein LOC110684763 [Chenopodium quinoa]